ncbi:hypothetical protein LTR28_009388 [Elasticomyces elasticus]|nr:hypothetical protein LTR28_009388 [Elasticomyces elasticus]
MSLQASFANFNKDYAATAARLSGTQKRTFASQAANAPTPTSRSSTPAGTGAHNDLKRKRPADTIETTVYSQPAVDGTGTSFSTQVYYAVEYLKSKDRAIAFKDVWEYLSVPDNLKPSEGALRRLLQGHQKVEYEPTGLNGQGSYRFRPTHNVRSADELKGYLQRQTTAQGIPVRELRDGWPSCLETVAEMEAKGEILVTHNKKDNAPKMIWANDPSLALNIDEDYKQFWHKTKLPQNANDLRLELHKNGITATSQVKETPKPKGAGKKRRKAVSATGRQTNSHMSAILKDYSHLKR